jgi:phage recombination protein Bet
MNELQIKQEYTQDQINLIKREIAKGATNDELALFLHQCRRTGLDPFARQIYFIKRGNKATIQVSIDGLRLIADRTERYSPGDAIEYVIENGLPVSATATVKKLVAGTWHIVKATAFLKEYKPQYDSSMWNKMPCLMIGKCAEALALRKAFPAELSGIYTDDEMAQAGDKEESPVKPYTAPANAVTIPTDKTYPRDKLRQMLINVGVPSNKVFDKIQDIIISQDGLDSATAHVADLIKRGYVWDVATDNWMLSRPQKQPNDITLKKEIGKHFEAMGMTGEEIKELAPGMIPLLGGDLNEIEETIAGWCAEGRRWDAINQTFVLQTKTEGV